MEYTLEQIAGFKAMVQGPGKFEGEHWSTVALWESMMDGGADETIFDSYNELSVFILTDEDKAQFEIESAIYAIIIEEDDNGFVWGYQQEKHQYDMWLKSIEAGQSDEE